MASVLGIYTTVQMIKRDWILVTGLARDRVLKTNSTLSNLQYLPQHLLKNNSVRMGRLGKIEP